jgi:hypothetical protein
MTSDIGSIHACKGFRQTGTFEGVVQRMLQNVLAQSSRQIFSKLKQCSEKASHDPAASNQPRSAHARRIRNVLQQAGKLTKLLTRHLREAQLGSSQATSSRGNSVNYCMLQRKRPSPTSSQPANSFWRWDP